MNLTQEQQINKELVEHLNRVKRELAAERQKAKKLLDCLNMIRNNMGSMLLKEIIDPVINEYNKNS